MVVSVASTPEPVPGRLSTLSARRIDILQGLRALAVLLVVWTHSILAAEYGAVTRQGNFFHLRSFGACGLDIFFVISGFIVSLVATRAIRSGSGSPGKFLSRRITRIFPLYWILTAVVILEAELGRHPILWHQVPWIPTLLLLPGWHYPVPPLVLSLGWSLLFEMYFYLVLVLWMRATPHHVIRNSMAFLGGMVALGMVVGIHRPLLVIWSNPVALEFLFGCLVAQLYLWMGPAGQSAASSSLARNQMVQMIAPWLAVLGLLALAATIFTGYGNAGDAGTILAGHEGWLRAGLWGLPSALLVAGAVLWNPTMASFPARFLIFLGDASFSIYLCTNPSRSLVEHFWHYFGRWGGDVGVVLCMIVCIIAGVLCYLAVERPLMAFFHNWHKQIPFRNRKTRVLTSTVPGTTGI